MPSKPPSRTRLPNARRGDSEATIVIHESAYEVLLDFEDDGSLECAVIVADEPVSSERPSQRAILAVRDRMWRLSEPGVVAPGTPSPLSPRR